jgi:S1-C subfamily serine protease
VLNRLVFPRPWDDTPTVNALDALLVLLIGLSVYTGWRRGFLQQGFSLAGTLVGIVAGAALAPAAADIGHERLSRLMLALGAVLIGASIGNLIGFLIGRAIRSRVGSIRTRRVDASAGAAMSMATVLIGTWFLGVNLAGGPFPSLARTLQGSAIVRILGALPPPPPLLEQVGKLADRFGFPDLFVGLPPPLGAPVPPPADPDVRAAAEAARASTFEVLGSGCEEGLLNEGSGFVVAPGYVLTNAHVVAGADEALWIQDGLRRHEASLVAFDPDLDAAVLHAPSVPARPLELVGSDVSRGQAGAILGYPGGQPLKVVPAAVRQTLEAVGRDIYGNDRIARRMYELQGRVRRGNSGGPFVLPDGRVAGVVFASSVSDDRTGYAIISSEVEDIVRVAVGRTSSVDPGRCVL